jgi:tagaturonate epimerase
VESEAKEAGLSTAGELKIGSNYLGKRHHPALGTRIPEIFLTGMVTSLQKHKTASGLMLSFGRETAPEEIINAPPGRYEITLGHTGTSIRKYIISGSRAARVAGIPVEMEADHLIVIESSAQAIKRIEGIKTPKLMGAVALERSLKYNLQAIEEAVSTGIVRAFTTDTSDLFDTDFDRMKIGSLRRAFAATYSESQRERIIESYAGKHRFRGADGKPVRLEITRERVMRLTLKYARSIEINAKLYHEIASRMKHPFAFEISLDETPNPTPPADLFVYLGEWKAMKLPCDFVAPNVGFCKREDFAGDFDQLRNRVRALHAVAVHYDALLSFHSGSGKTTEGGKGPGVYPVLLECTGRKLKYKISGIYFELLIEILAGHKKGTDARILYELIHREVMDFLRAQMTERGPISSKLLKNQLEAYDKGKIELDPRADAFRYHSFLCLNFRDTRGRRYYRERLIRLYTEDLKLRKQIDQEIEYLTTRLIDGLQFSNNY